MNKLDVEQFKQLLKINEMDQQEKSNQYLTDIYNMLKSNDYTEIEKVEIVNAIRESIQMSIIMQENEIAVIDELLKSEGDVH